MIRTRTVIALLGAAALAGTWREAPAQSTAYDTALFSALEWREIGPYRGGRSVAVAGSAARPFEYWMGTTGGGVFKTTDGGITWGPVTDKYYGGAIGYIGVSESNPDVVYVGTGEYPIRGNVSHGDGVWKTTDAGKTWTHVGLTSTRQISRVRVHPTNPDIVYVAALGHVWKRTPDRGIYKSTDGGKSWRKVLFRDDSTGASELVLDPRDPNTLYAGLWQAWRKPWQLVSGGPGSGLFKSTDGGEHWTEISRNPGLPRGLLGNIGIAVSPANPRRVWAIIEADSGGVFRSDDAGATWTRTNDERKLRQRAWYYSRIFADPKDTNTVYVLNTSFYRSTDGGKTFKPIPIPHGDSHDLWIAPDDPKRMIEGDDGGANVSFNGGKSWSEQDYATAQFYHVTTTMDFPWKACGAQQDNSTICIPNAAPGGIGMTEWEEVGGGESGYIAVRPDSTNIVYAGSYSYLSRKNLETGFERNIIPWPENPMGHSADDLTHRFQWTFPIVISPHDPHTLYTTSQVVFKSTNDGQSWTTISPDLTRHDPRTLGASGGPITKDQTSVEYYATVFALAESPISRGLLWAGSDDGLLHVSRDDGAHWTNVTPREIAPFTRISIIEPSHHDAGTAYVAANRYQLGDDHPYLYKTTDYGRTWSRIVSGIDSTEFTRVVREDPARRGLLYAGTERGVWISFDDGAHWQSLRRNLPPVPIHDLSVSWTGDLVAGTHGRSFWVLDDLSALRQLTPAVATSSSHLFSPKTAYRVSWGGGGGDDDDDGAPHPLGENPRSGATIYFMLDSAAMDVTLEFLDSAGTRIQRFTSALDSVGLADSLQTDSIRRALTDSLRSAAVSADSIKKLAESRKREIDAQGPRRPLRPPRVPNKAGLNRFVWDLRYPNATSFTNLIMWAASVRGPIAPPGTYAVRMQVNGGTPVTRTFELRKDPRSPATPAEIAEQFALAIRIRDRLSDANDAVRTIRNVRAQIDDRLAGASSGITAAGRALADTLSAIERVIYQVNNRSGQDPLNYPIRLNNRIGALLGVVTGTDDRPTNQTYAVFEKLSKELDAELSAMRRQLEVELPKLNAMLSSAGAKPIVPSTAEVAAGTVSR